jgi:hypothetical protein
VSRRFASSGEPQRFASKFARSREAISRQPSVSVWATERSKGGQVASGIGGSEIPRA